LKNSGTIDQDINFFATIDHCFYDSFCVIDLGNIAPNNECCGASGCNLRRDDGGIFLVGIVVNPDYCAGTAELNRDGGANATGSPSNQCDFALKFGSDHVKKSLCSCESS